MKTKREKAFAAIGVLAALTVLLVFFILPAGCAADNLMNETGKEKSQVTYDNPLGDALWLLTGLVALVALLGFVLLILGGYELIGKGDKDKKEDAKTKIILGGILFLASIAIMLHLLTIVLFRSQVGKMFTNATVFGDTTKVNVQIVPTLDLLVFVALLIFGAVLLMNHLQAVDQEQGQMRRMIAGILVMGLLIVVLYSLFGDITNKDLVTQYLQLVGIIVGFYFGARFATQEKYLGKQVPGDKIRIESAKFTKDGEKFKLEWTATNESEKDVKIKKIHIVNPLDSTSPKSYKNENADELVPKGGEPKEMTAISQLDLDAGVTYCIRAETDDGTSLTETKATTPMPETKATTPK